MSTRTGNRIRTLVTSVLVTLMLVGGLGTAGQVAAQNQTVQSQMTGVTVSYAPQYELLPESTYEPDVLEMLMFLGPADILAVGFMSPLIDINSARDILLEGMVGSGFTTSTIDRGDYTGVSYSLDMMNLDGVEMGVFTLFMNQRSHGYSEFYIFMAPPSLFTTTMQTAQSSFTIDGKPLMDGVDPTVMGNMVVANEGITGGTSGDSVSDVADTSDTNTTETTTTTTTTGAGDRDAYLAAVRAEYDAATMSFGGVIGALNQMRDEEITPEEALAIIETSTSDLAGTNDRIAGIQPPAGMEAFHQEFVAWAADVSAAGASWGISLESGNVDDFNDPFEAGLITHTDFGETLDAELANTGSSTGTEQVATEESSTTGDTSGTTADGMDRESYLAAVQAEYDTVSTEVANILDLLNQVSNDEITAEEALPGIDASHQVLAGTNERIGSIQPPVGMERFHQEFVAWAGAITDMGNGWASAVAAGDLTAYNELFTTALDTHVAFGETLEAESAGTGTSTGSEDVATEEATETATETTSRTTRTTRGSTTESTEEATETATETTSRTTRTTRGSTTESTEEATEGNSSETSGDSTATSNTGRTSRTTRNSSSTDSGDRDAYLESVREEYDHVTEQLTIIDETLAAMSDGSISDEDAIQALSDANLELSDAETRIEDLEAPEGMEAFHEEFLDWNADVVAIGELWADFVSGNVEASEYIDALLVFIDDNETFGGVLEDEEASGRIDITTFSMGTREMMAA